MQLRKRGKRVGTRNQAPECQDPEQTQPCIDLRRAALRMPPVSLRKGGSGCYECQAPSERSVEEPKAAGFAREKCLYESYLSRAYLRGQ